MRKIFIERRSMMKAMTLIWTVCVLVTASPVLALDAKAASQSGAAPAQSASTRHKATGVVKEINAKAGTATIEPGPVASLKWAGMTMPFTVKDQEVLAKMAVGKKIEFEIEQRGSEFVIVQAK